MPIGRRGEEGKAKFFLFPVNPWLVSSSGLYGKSSVQITGKKSRICFCDCEAEETLKGALNSDFIQCRSIETRLISCNTVVGMAHRDMQGL